MSAYPFRPLRRALILLTVVLAFGLVPSIARQRAGEAPRALTAADYARAEKFMSYNLAGLVLSP